jgi:hypothetical protein
MLKILQATEFLVSDEIWNDVPSGPLTFGTRNFAISQTNQVAPPGRIPLPVNFATEWAKLMVDTKDKRRKTFK